MPDSAQLPHLIKLLDDESPVVQDAVRKELLSFGHSLEDELHRMAIKLDEKQEKLLQIFFIKQHQKWLMKEWKTWTEQDDGKQKLETALDLLSNYQYAKNPPVHLKTLLDQLSDEFLLRNRPINPHELNRFLFKEKKIKGAQTDYFNPWNSNLIYAILNKRGIPITLACIYILVGQRLGLDIEGCNYPGHFLARIVDKDKIMLVDCYHGGKIVDAKEIIRLHQETSQVAIKEIIEKPADVLSIVCRVLRNLMRAYHEQSDHENHECMIELIKHIEVHENQFIPNESETNSDPIYNPGELVQHKLYGYRAVITAYDQTCLAHEQWYQSNLSQPPKDQPWYHLLVHGSNHTTYAAQSNLVRDYSTEKIQNPLIKQFFLSFENGKYVRNNQPWPPQNL
ncbi:MAG: heat shock protein HspQ [Chlamydiota bacterium]|nr:heat shock protein HspQ [Chlamydiota bacterium]